VRERQLVRGRGDDARDTTDSSPRRPAELAGETERERKEMRERERSYPFLIYKYIYII
jgi:hypothetical protein